MLVIVIPRLGGKKDLKTYIATLGAEEVANMPFSTACHNNFSFDGCLAALAAWAEQLVEIEVAVESWHAGLMVVGFCCQSFISAGLGLLVKGHTFEGSVAVEASEALWVESASASSHNLA
jgi:hypothetical protein